jgi:hypothetical protein
MMGNQNRFDVRLHISGSKKTWDVSKFYRTVGVITYIVPSK